MLCKRKVVLLANQRTSAMKASIDRTIWAPALTPKVMEVSLGLLCPRAQPQSIIRAVKVAGGDLRQAQLHMALKGNTPDKGSHVWFDVKDVLCHGKGKDLDYHERNWVSENHLQVKQSCEDHATLADSLTVADLLRDTDVADCFAGLATKKLVRSKRVDLDLKHPQAPYQSMHLKTALQNFDQNFKQIFKTIEQPVNTEVSRKRARTAPRRP